MDPKIIDELKREANSLLKALHAESDRGAALVAAAFLDVTLERLLRARFSCRKHKIARLTDPLFDAFGPLSTFSSKIRVAYAIDLLQDWMACDLDLIRRIRNEFSHSLEPMAFHEPSISVMVDQLVGSTRAIESIKTESVDLERIPQDHRSRFKFDVTCARIGALLQAKVVVQESDDAPDDMRRNFMISPEL